MSEHHEEYKATRICRNPDCELKGIPQPMENFYHQRKTCKSCQSRIQKNWRANFQASLTEYRKVIPDDDPETDLVPMKHGGFVRWAVLTDERRKAHGEQSPFNGLSVARDRAME